MSAGCNYSNVFAFRFVGSMLFPFFLKPNGNCDVWMKSGNGSFERLE